MYIIVNPKKKLNWIDYIVYVKTKISKTLCIKLVDYGVIVLKHLYYILYLTYCIKVCGLPLSLSIVDCFFAKKNIIFS